MYLCFVKQTTAYEMRISDWSSDVCSSDLAGWPSLACAPVYGGQGLPITLNNSVYEMFNSANQAWLMYAGLSHSAYECLRTHGTQQPREVYQIGRASSRERVCKYVSIPVVGVSLKKNTHHRVSQHTI